MTQEVMTESETTEAPIAGVQLSSDLHRRAKIYAMARGITLLETLNQAVGGFLDENQDDTNRLLKQLRG